MRESKSKTESKSQKKTEHLANAHAECRTEHRANASAQAPIPQIFFAKTAFQDMVKLAEKSKDLETGGLVLGKICQYETGRALVITKVSGPGPKAELLAHGFRPDMEYYRRWRKSFSDLQYLGEWHKHPHDSPVCSDQDLAQAKDIFAHESVAELVCPICVPVSPARGVEFTQVHCFYICPDLAVFLPLTCSILPEIEDRRCKLRYMAIEEDVVRNFAASRRAFQVVNCDEYADMGVVHIFASPYRSNASVILIQGQLCTEFPIAQGFQSAVVIIPKKGKHPQVRGYEIRGNESREIEIEVVSPKADMLSRNKSLLETRVLQNKHVAILGTGSIGSVAALELARAGVGSFTLIDSDTIRIQNLCRHICDLTELGMPKVVAVERRIHRIAPQAQVHALHFDTNSDPDATLKACSKADILLVATDTENSRKLANWIAHQHKIPAIFVGLLERAIGGRVWRMIPGKSACYECYPATQEISTTGPVSYSEIQSPHDLTIQPGLGNDIAFVTQLAVRYTIDTLGEQKIPYPIVFWFSHPKENWAEEPLTLYKVEELVANPNCEFCTK